LILAPEKRLLFIHVPKAAGTSINSALSMHDVFYPVRGGNVAAREAHAAKSGLSPAAAQLGEHADAKQFIAVLGRATYDSFYSFAFVRNPWDVAVSWFHYRLINPAVGGHAEAMAAGTFETYVRRVLTRADAARWVGLQHPFVTDEAGKRAVSFLGRYESLAADFATVIARLAVPTLALDRFNQSYHAPWPSLYSRETFEIVGALVANDAKLLGYPSDSEAYGIR
jgi:Sulfotransferase family